MAIAADLERVRLVRALQRVASGEAAALEDIYRRTSAKLFGVILRILGDRNEAEDVLQEVFVTVWNRAGSYDPTRGVSPITWLAAVARNRAIDRVRSRASRPTQPLEAAAEVAGVEVAGGAEEAAAVAGEAAAVAAGEVAAAEPRRSSVRR